MTDYSFTASAECNRCGQYLSASDEDCDNCAEYTMRRYHFVRINDSDRVETVWAITPVRAWKALGDRLGRDAVIPWTLYGRGTSLDYKQRGFDVTDEDDLRQTKLSERV